MAAITICSDFGLQSFHLFYLWDFPSQNTGVHCHLLLQGILLTQGSNPSPALAGRFFTTEPANHSYYTALCIRALAYYAFIFLFLILIFLFFLILFLFIICPVVHYDYFQLNIFKNNLINMKNVYLYYLVISLHGTFHLLLQI